MPGLETMLVITINRISAIRYLTKCINSQNATRIDDLINKLDKDIVSMISYGVIFNVVKTLRSMQKEIL